MIGIDHTPNGGYPLRILRTYRALCDAAWSDNTAGHAPLNPVLIQMNDDNRKRAEILDRAITLLERERQ